MDRGYPRPRINHNGKTYPLPYTATETHIANIEDDRLLECLQYGFCLVCGTGVDEDNCFALYRSGTLFGESGPFHEKCVKMTFAMCPHIKEEFNFSSARTSLALVQEEVSKWWV